MHVSVRLFAILKDKAGTSDAALTLPYGDTVAAAAVAIGDRFPPLRDLIPKIAFAVNRQYVKPEHVLSDGDELALIPAVSGGTELREQRLSY